MFEVVYGRGRPALLSYVKGTTKVSCGRRANWRDQMLDELKGHIKEAQAQMEKVYYLHHRDR